MVVGVSLEGLPSLADDENAGMGTVGYTGN